MNALAPKRKRKVWIKLNGFWNNVKFAYRTVASETTMRPLQITSLCSRRHSGRHNETKRKWDFRTKMQLIDGELVVSTKRCQFTTKYGCIYKGNSVIFEFAELRTKAMQQNDNARVVYITPDDFSRFVCCFAQVYAALENSKCRLDFEESCRM